MIEDNLVSGTFLGIKIKNIVPNRNYRILKSQKVKLHAIQLVHELLSQFLENQMANLFSTTTVIF